jgi:hypothetical protein
MRYPKKEEYSQEPVPEIVIVVPVRRAARYENTGHPPYLAAKKYGRFD